MKKCQKTDARSQADRIIYKNTHGNGYKAATETGSDKYRIRVHARRGQNAGRHKKNVRHGNERSDARQDLRADRRLAFGKRKKFV